MAPVARPSKPGNWPKAKSGREVMPVGVFTFDQIDLPLPVPAFELFFAQNCRFHVTKQLVTDKVVNPIFCGEPATKSFTVLEKTLDEIAHHTNVERPSPLTGKKVDAGAALERPDPKYEAESMLKQVQHDGIEAS